MDVSFILVIGLSAVLAAGFMIFGELTSRRVSIFRLPFAISYALGLLMMQPWRIDSANDAGMSAMTLVFIALWVGLGWMIGAVPAAMMASLVRWVSNTPKGRD